MNLLSQFNNVNLNLLVVEIVGIRNKSRVNRVCALMMFIVEAFIKMGSRSQQRRCSERFSGFSIDYGR